MLCLVTQPNTTVLEVQLDSKSNGHDCIEKVCRQLGIVECDYFGLQYTNDKGEQLWLNLRNDITRQVTPPFRLKLRVKFYLEPHYLLQEATRHQFYLNIRDDIVEGRLHAPASLTSQEMAEAAALLAQAEFGDLPEDVSFKNPPPRYGCLLDCDSLDVTREHARLRGMTRVVSEYKLFKEVSTWPCYGVAYHYIKAASGSVCSSSPAVPVEQAKSLGVGPLGISLHRADGSLIKAVVYSAIHMATLTRKCLFLEIVCDNGTTTILDLTLTSQRSAGALYRCVTEMYSFYLCDTVRSSVASQYSRDLKGTLAALFNENTSLGKSYIFDIRRTFREAYDHARRNLYKAELKRGQHRLVELQSRETAFDGACPSAMGADSKRNSSSSSSDKNRNDLQQSCDQQQQQQQEEDSMTCRVCMDRRIDCAFCPCGHVACCLTCAGQLDLCPLCRSDVVNRQLVFLPSATPSADTPTRHTHSSATPTSKPAKSTRRDRDRSASSSMSPSTSRRS